MANSAIFDAHMDTVSPLPPSSRPVHQVAVCLCRQHSLASIGLVLDTFRMANQVPGGHRFQLHKVSEDGQPVGHPDGLLNVDAGVERLAGVDLVVIPSLWTEGEQGVAENPAMVAALAGLPERVRVATLCTGAYLLAASGRLDHRPATTHWMLAEGFAARFPLVDTRAEASLTVSDGLICSGGSLAGVDACLHAIGELAGPETAQKVSQLLVTDLRRGPQSLYTPPVGWRRHADQEVRKVQQLVERDHAQALTLPALAQGVHMSVRTLQRRFMAATGVTPIHYQQQIRIERAKALLAGGSLPVPDVAEQVGYQDRVAFGRLFKKLAGMTPAAYRQKHQAGR